jgi:hypothetical protein
MNRRHFLKTLGLLGGALAAVLPVTAQAGAAHAYTLPPSDRHILEKHPWVQELARFWEEAYGMSLAEANRQGL